MVKFFSVSVWKDGGEVKEVWETEQGGLGRDNEITGGEGKVVSIIKRYRFGVRGLGVRGTVDLTLLCLDFLIYKIRILIPHPRGLGN